MLLLLFRPHRYVVASTPVNGFFVRNLQLKPASTITPSLASTRFEAVTLTAASTLRNVQLTPSEP